MLPVLEWILNDSSGAMTQKNRLRRPEMDQFWDARAVILARVEAMD